MRYFLIGFLLAGCGGEYEPMVTWSGNITEQSERFILSYDQALYTESQLPIAEQWWVDVQTCTGISLDLSQYRLIIEYTPIEQLPLGDGGRIELEDGYARVYENDLNSSIELSPAYYGLITRHEMIHYMLYIIGTPFEENDNHKSWMFGCAFYYP